MRLAAFILFLAWAAMGASYTTSFSGTENPLSESGNWTCGGAVGLDWTNMRKTPGLGFGTQSGTSSPNTDDSIACLTGTWASNQVVTGTFKRVQADNAQHEEVELLGRWSITAHTARGYEVNFGTQPGNGYTQIIRWNGALNDFTAVDSRTIAPPADGTVCKAIFSNNPPSNLRIIVMTNNVEIFHADITNPTWTNGTPGIGCYWDNPGTGSMANFGWSSYTAADDQPAAPTGPTVTNTFANCFLKGVQNQ